MKIAKKVFFIVLMICLIGVTKVYAQTGTINYEAVVLRGEASSNSEALAEAYEGENVEIIEKVDNWYKVEYKEQTGFIREDLINVIEEKQESTEKKEEIEKQEEPEKQEEQSKEQENVTLEQKEEEKKEEPKKEESKTINQLGEKQIASDTVCRIVPNLSASVLDIIKAGTKVTVVKVLNGWSCIRYNSNKAVWVPSNLLVEISETSEAKENNETEQKTEQESKNEISRWTGYINVSEAIIREEPSTSSEIVSEVTRNTAIDIIGEDGDWYKIWFDEKEAYIAKRLISDSVTTEEASRNQVVRNNEAALAEEITEQENNTETISIYEEPVEEEATYVEEEAYVEEEPEVQTPPPASSRGEEVVAKAKEYLGYDYVYGGAGPYSFDCSGFTMYIYSMFGVDMGHGATMQSSEGVYVPRDRLQPGDLLIFRDWDNTDIGHCGIYIGDGDFIHAANPSRGVVIDTIYSGYYDERYVAGRRVL